MPQYPETKLDRAVQRAVDQANRDYLEALESAGPDACPNCMKVGGGWCWCCTKEDGSDARDPAAWKAAQS